MTLQHIELTQGATAKRDIQFWSDTLTLIALAMGFMMATLDATVVNVAAATIQDQLHVSLSGVTWVVDGYILTFASLLLVSGSLANRFGAKTMYLTGLFVFVLASLLCAISPSGDVLVADRLIQGVGAALFMPSSLSLLGNAYPDEKKRAKMIGIWSALVSAASGLGPFIGGMLVSAFGWRSIFVINVPIGIVGLILAYLILARSVPVHTKLNLVSHGLGIVALASLSFVLIEAPSYGWTSSPILGGACLAMATAVLFWFRERRVALPVIPRELLKDSHFSSANMVGFLLNFALFGGIFMFGLFLQQARGASPILAGVELLPMMIVFVLGNLVFTRLTSRMGTTLPMLIALSVAGSGSLLLIFISPTMPYWLVALIFASVNFCVGVTVPAMTATLMKAAGQSYANIAGAALNANRQIGALVGVAVIGMVLHVTEGWYLGVRMTFVIMGIAYLAAAALAWRLMGKINSSAQGFNP